MKRVSSIDVIHLLREYKMNKKPIKSRDGYLYFGTNKFPLQTETAWQSRQTEKRYDLGSLWLCLEHNEKQSSTSQYYSDVTAFKLQLVSPVDKEEIISYFTGKIENSECINQELSQTLKRPPKKSEPNLKKKIKRENTEESKAAIEGNPEDFIEKEREQIKIIEFLNKIEKPLLSKNKAMRKNNKSFKPALEFLDKLVFREEEHRTNGLGNRIQQKSLLDELMMQEKELLIEGKPIILVPKFAKKGNLILGNAAQFLINGKYAEPNENTSNISDKQEIVKEIGRRKITFEIRNDVINFKEDTWKRLVAVFIEGVNNEFRDWPDGKKPAILFAKLKGFYMKYHDVPLSDTINQLNVTKLNIQRNKRFLDNSVRDQFWEELEKFLLKPRIQFKD